MIFTVADSPGKTAGAETPQTPTNSIAPTPGENSATQALLGWSWA